MPKHKTILCITHRRSTSAAPPPPARTRIGGIGGLRGARRDRRDGGARGLGPRKALFDRWLLGFKILQEKR